MHIRSLPSIVFFCDDSIRVELFSLEHVHCTLTLTTHTREK